METNYENKNTERFGVKPYQPQNKIITYIHVNPPPHTHTKLDNTSGI